jgi:MFS superfamily sulfate permease-like transporter
MIGPVAGGLPRFHIPAVAGSVLLLGDRRGSAATARVYATRHNQPLHENADLIGLSTANLAAGLSGTFVVNGSPTQTAMVESSGGRSQFAQIVTAVTVVAVLLFLTGPNSIPPALRFRRDRIRNCGALNRHAGTS